MRLPTVIKKLIKSFLGYDFQREYMLAIIRMLGRENSESPELQLYSEPQEFGEILADLKKLRCRLKPHSRLRIRFKAML